MKNRYIILCEFPDGSQVSPWGESDENPERAIIFNSLAAAKKEIKDTVLLGGLKTQIVKLELEYYE